MISPGEKAYAFSKASGIIGKSFVGRRIPALYPVSRLAELDQLVFGHLSRELPERELLPDLERRFSARSVDAVSAVLKSFRKPPAALILLLRAYEYSDLKTALALIAENETAIDEISGKPVYTHLGRFGTVNFNAWPDAGAMLAGTDYVFILEKLGKNQDGGMSMETMQTMVSSLDCHYYSRLMESLLCLEKKDRLAAEKITAEEIALRNCVWALRLRRYYGMKKEEVREHLVVIGKGNEFCADAVAALGFSLDDYGEWEKWKRVQFLNPDSSRWQADPRYFQNAAADYLYRLAFRGFRSSLSFIDKVFCFIKLKQFEEDLLTSCAEGLGLGMTSKDVFNMQEAAP